MNAAREMTLEEYLTSKDLPEQHLIMREYRALIEDGKWRDISGAPKDEKILLTHVRMASFELGAEKFPHSDYVVSGYFRVHGIGKMERDFKEEWYSFIGIIHEPLCLQPTHWKPSLPLPSPPQENE